MSPAEPAPVSWLTLPCAGCGKALRVKGELAGKKVKCPYCQAAVSVPVVARNDLTHTPAQSGPDRGETRRPQNPHDAETVARSVGAGPGGETAVRAPTARIGRERFDFLAPPQGPGELGRLGPFRVLEVLGAGGMGVVFRAEDPQLGRPLALKAMLPALAASDSARQRFLREARAAANIKHDHIVSIYQVGEDRGVPFLAMEFLEGESLDARLQREGKLPVDEVLRIGREIALGLTAAHQRGLMHRDIKPANLWLEFSTADPCAATMAPSKIENRKSKIAGRTKILDFGLARAPEEEGQLTQQGAIVGTPGFMAPEQVHGKSVDYRCDLFSLGCVLYRMGTGGAAFRGTDTISTLMAVATENPPPPHEREPGLPRELSALIMRLLAKDPDQRPPSAQAVAQTLETIAHAPAPTPRPRRPSGRPPVAKSSAGFKWLIGAGAAAGALVIFLLILWAAGVFNRAPTNATLLIEVNEPNPEVYVDSERVSVIWGADGKKGEITLPPGKRQVQFKKDGFTVYGEEVTLEGGGRRVITARLQKIPSDDAKPSDAVSLFNGKDLTGWVGRRGRPAEWLVNDGAMQVVPGKGNIITTKSFGPDFELHAEFNVPLLADRKGQARGNSGIYLLGRYEIQILDSFENPQPPERACAALYGQIGPSQNASRPPNEWQSLDITFRAPRLDPDNRVIRRGELTVVHNGVVVIDKGRFHSPTMGAPFTNPASTGPIVLQDHGNPVRFRNLTIKSQNDAGPKERGRKRDFVPLFNGRDLAGWRRHPKQVGSWSVSDGLLIGRGPQTSHLYSEHDDYQDFHLRVEARINQRGNSGVYLRCGFGPTWPANRPTYPEGYEAQIYESADARQPKTGSLFAGPAGAVVRVNESPASVGEWFTLEAIVRGNHIVIRVNGRTTADYIDKKRRCLRGGIALQVMDRPTVVEFRKIEIQEMPPVAADE
jgi:serine/threonine protein kinase